MKNIGNGYLWCRFKESLTEDDILNLSQEYGGDWGLTRGYLRIAFNTACIRKLENCHEDFKYSFCVNEKALKLSEDFLNSKGNNND